MHVRFLGKDPDSQEGQSPTLFATDRTDRKTYIAQGWVVTDPVALAELGDIPPGEAVIESPADVLRFAEEVRGACSSARSSPGSSARSSTRPSGWRHEITTTRPTRRRRWPSSSRASRSTWAGSGTGCR